MATTHLPKIGFAHYIYLPSEDHDAIRHIWSGLTQHYGLSDVSGDSALISGDELAQHNPVIISNERVALGLSILSGVTSVQLMLSPSPESRQKALQEIESLRERLYDHISYAAGETTIAIVSHESPDEIAHDFGGPFANQWLFEGEIKGARIAIVRPDDSMRHFYVVFEKNEPKTTDFLLAKLPVIDSTIFKLDRQATYFGDQRRFVHDTKLTADKGLSDILHKWADTRSSGQQNIDLLEKDVEQLSHMYGGLVAGLKLIKSAHDVMVKDVEVLETQAKDIIVNPADFANFRNAFVEDHAAFIYELSVDDERLHRSLDDTRATIEVVRTRIEIERSRESYLLQKEGATVQTAAGFIELFIIGVYTLDAWELLASKEVFESIAMPVRLGLDAMFAIIMVALTHFAAKLLQKQKATLGLTLSGVGVVIVLVLMALATRAAHV